MVPLRLRLVVFLLLFLCKKSAGQNTYFQDDSHTFYGGLVAGGNFTQVDGDTYEGYSKAGINVGAIVYARLSPATGISMEMIYTQKGSAAAYTSGSAVGYYEAQYHLKLNYVEVPVLFHFFTSRRLRYEAGASYAYLIRSDEWLYDASNFYINPDIYYFRKQDISALAGCSYQLYRNWFLEARFQYSLLSIRDASRIPIGGPGQYNNVWTLRLICFFNKPLENRH